MTYINEDTVHIEIKQSEPKEYLRWMMQALAAAVRWRAYLDDSDSVKSDRDNLIVLSDLMTELSKCED